MGRRGGYTSGEDSLIWRTEGSGDKGSPLVLVQNSCFFHAW